MDIDDGDGGCSDNGDDENDLFRLHNLFFSKKKKSTLSLKTFTVTVYASSKTAFTVMLK